MKEDEEMELHDSSNDFPHEFLLDNLGVSITQLSASTQREIQNFDRMYMDAIIDGTITKQEKQELVTASYEIAKNIQKEVGDQSDKNAKVTGIFTGILLAIGAVIGIREITKS